MMRYKALPFLLFIALLTFFGGPSLPGEPLIHEWGGSYRKLQLPPEHDELRREMLDGEGRAVDTLKEIPGSSLRVRYFTLEDEDGGPGFRSCFTFGEEWSLDMPGRGAWIFHHPGKGEAADSASITISPDGSSYLQVLPADGGDRLVFTIYLEGRAIQRSIPLPVPFDDFLRLPFSDFVEMSRGYVDWSFYFPDPGSLASGSVRELSTLIGSLIPRLSYVEDGALDALGKWVHINDGSLQEGTLRGLNCSGFVKWVVDGLAFPKTGQLFSVEALKRPPDEERENRWSRQLEAERQPWFGLDWTRNLALLYRRIIHPEASHDQVDVDDMKYHPYRSNVGYPVAWLSSLAWELAVREPGNFYLLSVNEQRGEPPLREHFHTAVMFPYLDEYGELQIDLYESVVRTPVETFTMRYDGAYVHLVRISGDSSFDPPAIRLEPTLRRQ